MRKALTISFGLIGLIVLSGILTLIIFRHEVNEADERRQQVTTSYVLSQALTDYEKHHNGERPPSLSALAVPNVLYTDEKLPFHPDLSSFHLLAFGVRRGKRAGDVVFEAQSYKSAPSWLSFLDIKVPASVIRIYSDGEVCHEEL